MLIDLHLVPAFQHHFWLFFAFLWVGSNFMACLKKSSGFVSNAIVEFKSGIDLIVS